MSAGWYFTAPWDPVSVRRGDALGFRAGADYFADLLAPGLSNSTSDARWISILSWCLQYSHIAWQNAGRRDLSSREGQRARYAWLRPLELLWVARTLKAGQDTGELRGKRSIKRWFNANEQPPNFAMSPDQFRRYRQAGVYGAYRVVLRAPELTTGDGWTPAPIAVELAKLVNDSLPPAARLKQEHFENGTKWGHWDDGNEARYWVEHGWQESRNKLGGLLPTSSDAARKQLPEKERHLLERVLFGPNSIRRVTVQVLASAKGARSHAELCDVLADSIALSKALAPASLGPLPAFTGLADAAMHAMRGLWNEVTHDDVEPAPAVEKLARSTDLQSRFDQLREASTAWLRVPGRSDFPHEQVVTRLAEAMRDATTPISQVRALSQHHKEYGGGRRWFSEQDGKFVPLVADTGIAASDYRFRLRSLCHLAAQCGVGNMGAVLDAIAQPELDVEDGDFL